jgi:PAS domain-containing protein
MVAIYPNTPHTGESKHVSEFVCDQVDSDEYGTLIFDRRGRICGSGPVAEKLFGAGRSRLTGQHISSLIPGIDLRERSVSHNANYLSSLCANRDWQQFDAMDILGRGFAIEIRISRRMMDSLEAFVLDFRCPQ